jgi:GH15 family glucan-1,4-alpha-glucosidase
MAKPNNCPDYPAIAAYGIIGDCHTAALITSDGFMDWYCPGRFDNPAVFCRLLDRDKGGYFQVNPKENFTAQRHYAGHTNILETEFRTNNAQALVTDFMPVYGETATRRGRDLGSRYKVLKKIAGLAGELELMIVLKPTFDYASVVPTLELTHQGAVARAPGHKLVLTVCGLQLAVQHVGQGSVGWCCRVKAGTSGWFILSVYAGTGQTEHTGESLTAVQCEHYLQETRRYWQDWAGQCQYQGPYRREVIRSALTLKLLIYEPTGALVAAPTTSLPEDIGGMRNWDYRYAWLRDSSLILYALLSIGYKQEAADFFEWLQSLTQADPDYGLSLLYSVDGQKINSERELPHLTGYRCSAPVRIGNAAGRQKQLDIYGELLNSAYLYFKTGIGRRAKQEKATTRQERLLQADWPLLRRFVDKAAAHWQEADNSIWEVRGQPQNFLYSKLMCWAALDRGIKLARAFALDAPLDDWKKSCKMLRKAILQQGYDPDLGAFVQAFGSKNLDASSLVIPRLGFLPGTDKRVQSTISLLQKKLTRHGLVYRYRMQDGLPGSEHTFALCSFWMVDALSFSGQIATAHNLFEHLCSMANDLGLFSEELDPIIHLLLGNFPQGFTHMALINSAVNMAKVVHHGPEKHSENDAQRARKAGPAVKKGYSHV